MTQKNKNPKCCFSGRDAVSTTPLCDLVLLSKGVE